MCDHLWREDDEGFDVCFLRWSLRLGPELMGSLARAFKRAGWKVIGVEEEG